MKNLTKIFMAVAVALFAFSCVQDATEDLGVKVGGQTELTLSIEESRTQLGEKAGSLYPVTWCEGDVVAVNGVASTGIEIVGNGTSATFTFPEAIARPWSVVYPATTATPVTEGLQAVTFLATQEYKVGTFCDGAAPMYGVAAAAAEGEAAPAIQLNHLTGVLRFAVKGAGEKLTALTVTTESGKIAGNFDVDCATGALTAHEDASNTIAVTFGEGLTLGEVATPIYVAVPAGEYGAVTVVLATDDAKKMTAKFGSNGEKQIKAGIVREFTEFTFSANDVETDWFEIYTVADMLAFAKTATNFSYTGAKVMAPINMTGVEWTPIEGFGKVFDGGKFEIKGLKAPLFGTASATIKNVKLTEVDITTNGILKMGAIVNVLTSNGLAAKASLTNCSASGKLTVSNPEWVPTSDQEKDAKVVNYGGLVGVAYGADITTSTNNVAITVSQMQKHGNTAIVYSSIGGVVGYGNTAALVDSTDAKVIVTGCKNNAAIQYIDTTSSESKALVNRPYLGGILGYGEVSVDLLSCENTATGDILLNTYTYGEGAVAGGVMIGGIAGYTSKGYLTTCINRGDVQVDGTLKSVTLGGIVGYTSYCWTDGCENHGVVELKSTARMRGVVAGGVAGGFHGDGSVAANTHNFKNCTNHGEVKILASHEENFAVSTTSDAAYLYRIGGIAGYGCSKSDGGCTNNGKITISGDVKIAACNKDNAESILIAGCLAYQTKVATGGKWENNGDIEVDATFTYDDDTKAGNHPISVSGVFGPQPGNPTEAVNNGDILYNGKYEGTNAYTFVGGIYAGGVSSFNNFHKFIPLTSKNTGNITIGDDAKMHNVYVAGINPSTYFDTTINSAKNEGKITVNAKATISNILTVAGVFGLYGGGNLKNVTNSGNIEVNAGAKDDTRVGGIFGNYYIAGKTLTDITNTGNITITGTHAGIYTGGIIGTQKNKSITGNLLRVVNGALGADGKPDDTKGKITISANSTNDGTGSQVEALTVAGLNGGRNYNCRFKNMEDCHNYGDIYAEGTFKGRAYMSGISMGCQEADIVVKNCSSQGDITFAGTISTATTAADAILSMCLWLSGYSYTMDKAVKFENFKNSCNLTIAEDANVSVPVHLCGMGYRSLPVITNCEFSGNYVHAGKQKKYDVHMGAIGSERAYGTYNGLTNSVNMEFSGENSGSGHIYMGGLGRPYGTAMKTTTGTIMNTGTIAFTGSSTNANSDVHIGGLFSAVTPYTSGGVTTLIPLNFTASGGEYIYKGNVVATGKAAGHIYAGGVIGKASSPITGAKVECNIKAYIPQKDAAATQHVNGHVGIITGADYAAGTVEAKDCLVRGSICTKQDQEGNYTDDAGDYHPGTITDKVITIAEDNLHEYIYGSSVAVNLLNGCTVWK